MHQIDTVVEGDKGIATALFENHRNYFGINFLKFLKRLPLLCQNSLPFFALLFVFDCVLVIDDFYHFRNLIDIRNLIMTSILSQHDVDSLFP
jgi:hypothetical protein